MPSGLIAQADIGERRGEQPAEHGKPDEILHREKPSIAPVAAQLGVQTVKVRRRRRVRRVKIP
jgi:hypothetical protein